MNEHLIHDFQHYATVTGVILAFGLMAWAALYLRTSRRATAETPHDPNILQPAHKRPNEMWSTEVGGSDISSHDTVFILPDISHYTRFIAAGHFNESRAQEIIFSLMNAMISAGTRTVELSKLEGDAVLFFTDARNSTNVDIGQTVMAIFDAFFTERERLLKSNICHCRECEHVRSLDLKVFVHRGQAKRFEFRGSIDHFGADVTILHKLVKNGVAADRYVMVTEAATGNISLPGNMRQYQVQEDLEHVGKIQATVFTFGEQTSSAITVLEGDRQCAVAH